MRIVLLTNEYPPHTYGGAGVHGEYLARELARLAGERHTLRVLCNLVERPQKLLKQIEGDGS